MIVIYRGEVYHHDIMLFIKTKEQWLRFKRTLREERSPYWQGPYRMAIIGSPSFLRSMVES